MWFVFELFIQNTFSASAGDIFFYTTVFVNNNYFTIEIKLNDLNREKASNQAKDDKKKNILKQLTR